MHLITTSHAITITLSKINAGTMITILLSFASLLTPRNAPREISAAELTIEWKDYTIKTSIKLNFVIVSQIRFNSVNIVIIAPSLIQLKILRCV